MSKNNDKKKKKKKKTFGPTPLDFIQQAKDLLTKLV